MDPLLFHPKIVHLPMALAVLMPVITGGILFAVWRGWLERRVWVGAVLLQALLVGSGALAMKTGEREEDRVEEVVPEAAIDAHEEAAEAFVWASAAVLLLMALPIALPGERIRNLGALGALVGTVVVLGFGYEAGEAGGRLVYELGAAQAYVGSAGAPIEAEASGDEDSDS